VLPVLGLTFTRRVGSGGEAEVFEVAERPGMVCKRYRQPTRERAEKLQVMVASPPSGTTAGGHVSIAWPVELVVDRGDVTGFLMPRIDAKRAIPVFQVYNPATRLQLAPGFTWRYLLRTARNVAAIVDSLHAAGYVVGDLNESNLLVDRRALVSLVDCDSMQVTDPLTGRVHPSPVGKPEFLAPELHGADLSRVERTPASDVFALTVLVCQLLMEGVHPYAGVWKGPADPPQMTTRIRRGWSALAPWSPVKPPPHAVPFGALPADVRRLVRRGLARRPSRRPAAWEWVAVLEEVDAGLRTCRRSPHHVFGGGWLTGWLGVGVGAGLGSRRRCPWCARIDRGLPDPFPGPSGASTLTRRPPPLPKRLVVWMKGVATPIVHTTRRAAVVGALPLALACAAAAIRPEAAVVAVPGVAVWRAAAAREKKVRALPKELWASVTAVPTTATTALGLAVSGLTVVDPPGWRLASLALRLAAPIAVALHAAHRRRV
jgi:DNA-binding helix-hairpin-helix protein with protein kinase domain